MIKKMSSKTKTLIDGLLADPQRLIEKKPFTRGTNFANDCTCGFIDKEVPINGKVQARLSTLKRRIVSQDEFVRELDPMSHKVLFDANIPSITMKNKKGQMYELEYKKMAVPSEINQRQACSSFVRKPYAVYADEYESYRKADAMLY